MPVWLQGSSPRDEKPKGQLRSLERRKDNKREGDERRWGIFSVLDSCMIFYKLFGKLIHVFNGADRGKRLQQMWKISKAWFHLNINKRNKTTKRVQKLCLI